MTADPRPPLSIVILAAGQGKRMKSDLPKVLQPLAGKPLLEHVVLTARALEPRHIDVVYGHGGERVRDAMASHALSWSLQAEQLGTGHALMQAMPKVTDAHTVLVLYGDVPLIRLETLRELLGLAGGDALGILTFMAGDPSGYGRIIRDAKGERVQEIVEHKDATAAQREIRECNSGVLAGPAHRLRKWLAQLRNDNAQGEYYLTDVVAAAVAEGVVVKPLLASEEREVAGVNDKAQLAEVEGSLRLRRARELMLAGVTVADPARLDVRGNVTGGRDAFIDINVVLEGEVQLGARARIGANCVIRNSQLGDDVEIHPSSVIDGARVGAQCSVGPFARLRPGALLERGVHIGNFVEVKNTALGEGSKANHLTYLGDAVIGGGVNVGAGTVTCNYDGANKSVTRIGDGAFIGSGTMLVAPVSVGAGATIGAGSTITKDAPDNELTLERSKQVTISGWKRPLKKKPGD